MSKEEKKDPKQESPSVLSEQLAQAVMALAEQQKQLISAQNQQTEFSSGLAERVTKIEQSLSGLADTLKAAAASSKEGTSGNPIMMLIGQALARDLGGGGGFEKLAKSMLESKIAEMSAEGQMRMFNQMLGIFERGVRLGNRGIKGSEAGEGLTGPEK